MADAFIQARWREPALDGQASQVSTEHTVSSLSYYSGSGGARAVKKPGHFEARKSSSQVSRSPGCREWLACPRKLKDNRNTI